MSAWALPIQPAERHLLVAESKEVQFMGKEDPKFSFARISRLETTMRAVGIEKSESEITYPLEKTPSVPPTPNARPTKLRNKGRRRVRPRPPRTRMFLSSAVVLGGG